MTQTKEVRWLTEQIAWRQQWCQEGVRGGHSDASVARWREDLVILAAIVDRLDNPMPLFRQVARAAAAD